MPLNKRPLQRIGFYPSCGSMADKTSWTEPLDSARGALETVRSVRTRATVCEIRSGRRSWRTQCTGERVVLESDGFDYDVGHAAGQCNGAGRAEASRSTRFAAAMRCGRSGRV